MTDLNVSQPATDGLLNQADERLADWNRRSRQWYLQYYATGALAVALTITVASRPEFIPKLDLAINPCMACCHVPRHEHVFRCSA
jgi:hypothetical protein